MQIRHATRSDLDHLAAIEAAADTMYVERFGAIDWDPPHAGTERAAAPGFLLAAVDDGAPYGFVHVLDIEGRAHLEQLAVVPERQRRGVGSALVRAAAAEAAGRGHRELTLLTYAEVPWNAPFYRRLGFVAIAARNPVERQLVLIERGLGLDRHGPRTLMVARVTRQGVTSE